MRILIVFILAIALMSGCTPSPKPESKAGSPWPSNVQPPVAEKTPSVRILHGDTVVDEYAWMNAYFKKTADSTRVIEYLKAENAYLDTMMSGTRGLQEKLFEEMKGRIKEQDESVPYFKNGYYYYTRTEEGKQYFKFCRKKQTLEGQEEILLDVDQMAEGHAYYSATGFSISDDNTLMAFGVDTVSRRQYTIHVKNLLTGEILPDALPGTSGYAAWAADNKTLFYTRNNPATLLSEKIMRHELGNPAADDVMVYYEKDASNYIGVGRGKSDKYLFIYSYATLSSEIQYLDAGTPKAAFKVFQPRMKEVLYSIEDVEGKFLIVTNLEAKNFRLMECPMDQTAKDSWKEVIAHRSDVLLEGIEVFKNHLVITERKNGLIQLRIRDQQSGDEHYLDFGEPAYLAYVGKNADYNSQALRYGYTSLTTPNSTYDYDMKSQEKKLMKQQPVLGGYRQEDYVTERLYAPGNDGVQIPISLVYKKGFQKNGSAPLLLEAYGSYGSSYDAAFSSNNLSLLDRGFVYAIAHIRGGQELGRQWYEDGKMMKKKNSFYDFISCAQFLIGQQYTSKGRVYAQGGSAGGLLMGAVATMEPGLWNGVIAEVPFVDVINTMLDTSIPLTTNEFDEWGNPVNKEAYDYMKSYSPYENVEKKEYPNLLVTTGLHDSQVQYFEPAKWVAKLRAHKTDNNVLLLHTNMEFGHGGASGRFDYLKDLALQYAFLFSLEGIEE
jgi:oligopeptidase B